MVTGLMAHTGNTFKCTREELRTAPLPQATPTWRPVPHYDLATMIVDQAGLNGFEVQREEYAMTKNLMGVFGAVTMAARDGEKEMTRMIGFRHDNEKNMALSLCVGARVFVCDNMCFSGDRILTHKHSGAFDFRLSIPSLFYGLEIKFDNFREAVNVIKAQKLTNLEARNSLIDACDAGAFASCDIMPIVKEYECSSVKLEPGTRWSLYNAITFVAKKFQPAKFDNCLRTLSGLFDLGGTETIDVTAETVVNPA